MSECPCGSGVEFDACCGPVIGGEPALTAEALMRSRYAAYVLGDLDHIENTHASDVSEAFNRSAAEATARSVEWVGLDIRDCAGGGEGDDTGSVEFAAKFRKDGDLQIHHEISNFKRQGGRWVYVDGKMNPKGAPRSVNKVGRNEPCPCGSGKKFKKCCGS